MSILAIDYGEVRTGLALSRTGLNIALPYKVVESSTELFAEIANLQTETGTDGDRIHLIVLGLPLNMDGSEGFMAGKVRKLAAEINHRFKELELVLVDERRSSRESGDLLRSISKPGQQRKSRSGGLKDQLAAQLLLQTFLDQTKTRLAAESTAAASAAAELKTLEKSAGAVIFINRGSRRDYLLIQHCWKSSTGGHWGFPKGHLNSGETEIEAAIREIHEETNLVVRLIPGFNYRIDYQPSPGINKQAVYFLAEADFGIEHNQEIILQPEEIQACCLAGYQGCFNLLTHRESKWLLVAAEAFLTVQNKVVREDG